ncbi:uncharacterized protein LOC107035827 [Diachasma alloeum]|uniref:uncharacterized protein LOC107035827 n=1 Tax=Diachasma alloeum TaxID=454923 RepID=UPI000738286A|nr:uncharacterized protein LOC107035827 [Diachasma alloeum]
MRPSVILPVLVVFVCTRVVITEAKLQQQATIDVTEEDEDDDDYDDDYSKPEIDDDGRIYKNPRNSPSAMCPRDESQAKLLGQKCLRKCSTDEDCKSSKKKCRCDGICGMSCLKPEKMCPTLPEISYGKMTVTGNFFGDTVHYECDPDYFMVGLAERNCRGDGTWSGTVPACKKDTNSFCSEPPKIANAKNSAPLEQTTFDLENTVQYYCDHGYETRTLFQSAKCLMMDGKVSWFGPDIACSPKNCGPPPDIPNGWHAGECHTYNCRVSYHCADGHELVGRAEKVCLADGTWTPKDLPQCVQVTAVQCPLPDHPTNGKAIYTSYAYNAIVSYECRYGYILVGQATRKCQADRKWSGQAPMCKEIDCGSPGILYNGWIEGIDGGTGLGASIIFRCETHMKLEGNTSSVCQKDGKWRYPLPHCLAPCIIPQIEKGHITVDHHDTSPDHINNVTVVEHGEKLRVFCIPNYEFAQNSTPVVCNNGTWSIIPTCSPARCKQLPRSPKNGMVIAPKMNHGMKAVFKCKDGFVLIGGPKNDSFHVECHYGTWIGHTPHCEEVYCAFPGYVPNGKVLLVGNMGVYDYRPYVKKVPNNKQIMYDCDKGYVLSEGPPGATCVGGKWSPTELPACLPGQHPRIRWSRRRRSVDELQASVNSTTNFKKFIEFFRRVGKKLLHMELDKAQEAERRELEAEEVGNFTAIPLGLVDNKPQNSSDKLDIKIHSINSSGTMDNLFVRKKHSSHRNKSRSKDDKMIDFLKIVYRKLKRIDSRRNNTGVNTTMHELLNLMTKNFFHVDLAESRRNNTNRNHDSFEIRNQREFTKLKREFERIMKFYNKSLRWSEKQSRKDSKRRKTEHSDDNKVSKDKKRKKGARSKSYYRGFYEFINGYVNEKLSILESQNGTDELMRKMNIDKFTVRNGTTFTVGEIYAFFKHIIDNKLHSEDVVTMPESPSSSSVSSITPGTNDNQTTSSTATSSTTEFHLDNEIPNSGNKSEIAKHRTKRIRNASEQTTSVPHQNRKLLSVNSPLSSSKASSSRTSTTQLSKSKQFTLNGLDAQQQSRTKRFLPPSELDNQIFLKNLYLNAYEDEYRANVRRSITQDSGRTNWTALRRRKGNLGYYSIK